MIILVKPNPMRRSSTTFERLITQDARGKAVDTKREERLTRAPGTSYVLCAPMKRSLGGHLDTGMLDEVDNPYYGQETIFIDTRLKEALSGKKAKLQHIIEQKHKKAFDFYTNQIDFRGNSAPTYFQRAEGMISLADATNKLDLDLPHQEILYYVARANPDIANSYGEMTAEHTYYMVDYDKDGEAELKSTRSKDLAISTLSELDRDHPDVLLKCAKIIGLPGTHKNVAQAYTDIRNEIEKNKWTEFMKAHAMWKEPSTRKEFNSRAILSDLLDNRIITVKGSEYTWIPPVTTEMEKVVWDRKEDVIAYLSEEKYAPEVTVMIELLKASKNWI